MTQAQLNTHIIHLQNLYADLVSDKYVAKLKIGKVCKEAELAMLVTRKYIKYLYKYQPLEADVTYAYSFTIDVLSEDTITIEIIIGLDTFTYTGDAILADILNSLKTSILASSNYEFEISIIDGVLYVYSYDNTLTFATTTTVSSSDTGITTIQEENIQNSYCSTLLNNVNCLTVEELCGIIKHGVNLLSECNC